MMSVFRLYATYVMWIVLVGVFAYIFQVIYMSGAWDFLLTFFLVISFAFVMYVTR